MGLRSQAISTDPREPALSWARRSAWRRLGARYAYGFSALGPLSCRPRIRFVCGELSLRRDGSEDFIATSTSMCLLPITPPSRIATWAFIRASARRRPRQPSSANRCLPPCLEAGALLRPHLHRAGGTTLLGASRVFSRPASPASWPRSCNGLTSHHKSRGRAQARGCRRRSPCSEHLPPSPSAPRAPGPPGCGSGG